MYVCQYVCVSCGYSISVSFVVSIYVYLFGFGAVGAIGSGYSVLRLSTVFIVVYIYAAF